MEEVRGRRRRLSSTPPRRNEASHTHTETDVRVKDGAAVIERGCFGFSSARLVFSTRQVSRKLNGISQVVVAVVA